MALREEEEDVLDLAIMKPLRAARHEAFLEALLAGDHIEAFLVILRELSPRELSPITT